MHLVLHSDFLLVDQPAHGLPALYICSILYSINIMCTVNGLFSGCYHSSQGKTRSLYVNGNLLIKIYEICIILRNLRLIPVSLSDCSICWASHCVFLLCFWFLYQIFRYSSNIPLVIPHKLLSSGIYERRLRYLWFQ